MRIENSRGLDERVVNFQQFVHGRCVHILHALKLVHGGRICKSRKYMAALSAVTWVCRRPPCRWAHKGVHGRRVPSAC